MKGLMFKMVALPLSIVVLILFLMFISSISFFFDATVLKVLEAMVATAVLVSLLYVFWG